MIICEQDEQRQIREHHGSVDPVEIHVPQNVLGLAVGGGPAELPVLGDRPTVVPDRVQLLEFGMPAGHQRLIERELLFPEGPIPQMLRKTGLEQIDRLDDVRVTRNDKFP